MSDSDSTFGRLKQAGGEPVTWKALAQTGLVVGSLLSGIWLARESSQDAEIASKADKQDIARSLDKVEAGVQRLEATVNGLFMKLIADVSTAAANPFGAMAQVQGQQQSVHVKDVIGDAIEQEFAARIAAQPFKKYPPCMTGETDALQRPGDPVPRQATGTVDGDREQGGSRRGTGSGRNIHADVYATGREP